MNDGTGRPTAPWVVFTDLDGTLLEPRTYSAAPAAPALAALAARGVPVVFCSSKTAAEQRPIRRQLGLEHAPFIVENGSAVIVPAASELPTTDWARAAGEHDEFVRVLGRPAAEVRAGISRAAAIAGVRVRGYGDLTAGQVAALTGLDDAGAARARQRDYSETLVDSLPPGAWERLEAALTAEGLHCQHGGRFRTVTAAGCDKGRAARLVAQLFSATAGAAIVTVGLGDSANDADLLAAVDRPYLLARDGGGWAPIELASLRRINRSGPHGWNQVLLALLGVDEVA